MSVASVSLLTQLYTSLCSNSVTGYTASSIQTYVMEYLDNPSNQTAYNNMAGAITAWLNSSLPQTAVGSPTPITSLRVFIVEGDGSTAYDSLVGSNNQFNNINVPRSDFLTTGRYIINSNLGSRSYIQAASLSQTGVFSQYRYSNTSNKRLLYFAVRQGVSSADPLGFIVLAMDV